MLEKLISRYNRQVETRFNNWQCETEEEKLHCLHSEEEKLSSRHFEAEKLFEFDHVVEEFHYRFHCVWSSTSHEA